MIDVDGKLYTTSQIVCDVFNSSNVALRKTKERYPEDFVCAFLGDILRVTNCHSKEEVCSHLNIERIRNNTLLWTEEDIISLTYHLKCPTASATRREFTSIIKQHATKGLLNAAQVQSMVNESVTKALEGMVSLVQVEQLIARSQGELLAYVVQTEKARKIRASAAGKSLAACKLDKDICAPTLLDLADITKVN
jgi:hypothetical protein